MSVAEAVGKLTLDATGFVAGANQAVGAMDRVKRGWNTSVSASRTATAGVLGLGAALGGVILSSTLTAARTETMAVAFETVAGTAKIAKKEQDAYITTMKKQGIASQEAYGIGAKFIQSQLDLADATKISRVAQDLAVITGRNSSETAETLTNSIVTQNAMLLRNSGITTTAGEIFEQYGEKIGKTATELTEAEKKQAFINKIMEEGSKVAGVYEKSMEKVGKRLGSFPRYFQEAANSIGSYFLPAMAWALDVGEKFLKSFTPESVKEFMDSLSDMKPVLFAFAFMMLGIATPAIIAFLSGILATTAAIAPWAVAFGLIGLAIWPLIEEYLPTLKAMLKNLPEAIADWKTKFDEVMGPIVAWFKELEKSGKLDDLREAVMNLYNAVKDFLLEAWERLGPKVKDFVESSGPALANILQIIADIIDVMKPAVIEIVESLVELAGAVADLLGGDWESAWEKATNGPTNVILTLLGILWAIGRVKAAWTGLMGLLGLGGGGAAAGGAAAAGGGKLAAIVLALSTPLTILAILVGTVVGTLSLLKIGANKLSDATFHLGGAQKFLEEKLREVEEAEKDVIVATDDLRDAEEELRKKTEEVEEAQKEVHESVRNYGIESDITKDAVERLNKKQDEARVAAEKVETAQGNLKTKTWELKEATGEATSAQQNLIDVMKNEYKNSQGWGVMTFLDAFADKIRETDGMLGWILRKLADIAGFDYSSSAPKPPAEARQGGTTGGGGGGAGSGTSGTSGRRQTFAAGGFARRMMNAVVGEAGTEVIINLTNPRYRQRSLALLQSAAEILRPPVSLVPQLSLAGAAAPSFSMVSPVSELKEIGKSVRYGDVSVSLEGVVIANDLDIEYVAERLGRLIEQEQHRMGEI